MELLKVLLHFYVTLIAICGFMKWLLVFCRTYVKLFPQLSKFSQCRLIEAKEDQVKVEFDVTEQMTKSVFSMLNFLTSKLSSWDNLHGGCTASLVDMITTIAILSHDTNKHPGGKMLTIYYL